MNVEIHKYNIKTGIETCVVDDCFYVMDGDKHYLERYLCSLNESGGKNLYYYAVPIYEAIACQL